MMNANSDKEIERSRYDSRASDLLLEPDLAGRLNATGAISVALELRAPYIFYESALKAHLPNSPRVLEICAGTGMHSGILLAHCAGHVVCSDISEHSLQILKNAHAQAGDRLSVRIADMERLPFDDHGFDLVACAGGLSYGDPQLVMSEINRVLKPGGHFVCVDSFNENPIYRFNRWLHYLRGERTKSTLLRMPGVDTIDAYRKCFGRVDVRYFGSIAWLSPILKRFMSAARVAELLDRWDGLIGAYRSAFKFVMVAQK